MNVKLDHIAIQTDNYDHTVQWYKDFFGCEETWGRTWAELPEKIQKRMPLATRLVELKISDIRFHVFDIKQNHTEASTSALQYQHFGIVVDTREDLENQRQHWIDLYESDRYAFKKATMPSEMIASPGGMLCFYAFDPNGLEFEVIHFE